MAYLYFSLFRYCVFWGAGDGRRGGGGGVISIVDYFLRFFTTWLHFMVNFYLFLFFNSELLIRWSEYRSTWLI